MSTKFVVVKQEPEELPKNTVVIKAPDFMDEIKANSKREPRGNITASTHLRYIVGSIGEKYDNELGAYTVKPHLFEGRRYENDQELSKIVVEMLKSQYPKIFDKYLDYKVKNRPSNTKLIYYVGNFADTTSLFMNGVDKVEEKDVDAFLGLNSKKTTNKTVTSNEETTTLPE